MSRIRFPKPVLEIWRNSDADVWECHPMALCPHCDTQASLTVVAIPMFSTIMAADLNHVGLVYKCDVCQGPVFVKMPTVLGFTEDMPIVLNTHHAEMLDKSIEPFEYEALPEPVRDDFKEAARCLASECHNAFAAMCRRTLQSACSYLGAEGSDKVQKQIRDVIDVVNLDDDIAEILKQLMIDGHDGAHPHLPKMNSERAQVLMELMKDVLDQLFVRRARMEQTRALRQAEIERIRAEKAEDSE